MWVIYKLLGKRFDSPAINTYIYQKDFCKFCADLKYYLSCELVFFQNDSNTRCPYAYLGDGDKRITIQFTHYHNEEEARNKWNERKERIHWDNLYIMTNDGNKADLSDFNLLERVPCKRKVIFTSRRRPEIADSFELYAMNGQETAVFMMIDRNYWIGYRPWEEEFDFTAWLNDEKDFRYDSCRKKKTWK